LTVVGIGTDIVAVSRIASILKRHGGRFLDRCFSGSGPEKGGDGTELPASLDPGQLAERWAAKEAFLKALGREVGDIPYNDIEVVPTAGGENELIPRGRAKEVLALAGGTRVHLSTGRQGNCAVAMVLIQE
jgi:holo-[acyl-carrier protein] synthase